MKTERAAMASAATISVFVRCAMIRANNSVILAAKSDSPDLEEDFIQ
jgi:hypothetical protein